VIDSTPRFSGAILLVLWFLLLPINTQGEPLARALERGGYTSAEKTQIAAMVADAERSGISPALLLPRVEEAAAKRVSGQDLIAALAAEIGRLNRARDLLAEAPASMQVDAVLLRTANLILWGATPQEVSSLVVAVDGKPRRFAGTTSLFTALVAWGLDRQTALLVSQAVAVSALDDREVAEVTRVLAAARRRRERPEDVAERLIRTLPTVRSLRQLEEEIRYE
jgi:hypothetical protein